VEPNEGLPVMQLFALTYPTLAVSAIYCIWQAYLRAQLRKRILPGRVAYMLWVAADGMA
jgi:hypothetical protein